MYYFSKGFSASPGLDKEKCRYLQLQTREKIRSVALTFARTVLLVEQLHISSLISYNYANELTFPWNTSQANIDKFNSPLIA
jgi:hypothetical protein